MLYKILIKNYLFASYTPFSTDIFIFSIDILFHIYYIIKKYITVNILYNISNNLLSKHTRNQCKYQHAVPREYKCAQRSHVSFKATKPLQFESKALEACELVRMSRRIELQFASGMPILLHEQVVTLSSECPDIPHKS